MISKKRPHRRHHDILQTTKILPFFKNITFTNVPFLLLYVSSEPTRQSRYCRFRHKTSRVQHIIIIIITDISHEAVRY
jgi:hypothetical protein